MKEDSRKKRASHLRLIKPESENTSDDGLIEEEEDRNCESQQGDFGPGIDVSTGDSGAGFGGGTEDSDEVGWSGDTAKKRDGSATGQGLSDLLTDRDERALARYLGTRERAPTEVRQYLTRKGILKTWHDSILDRLMEMDLINEQRFCFNRIEHRLKSGQGPRRIEQELGSLGIDRYVARDCLASVERHEWEENCLEVASEKLESIMDREDSYWKVMQFLNYRGFESVHIEWAINALKDRYPLWAKRFSRG